MRDDKSVWDDRIVRGFLALLSIVGQFLTVKELLSIGLDLVTGAIDSKFYLSIAFISVVFPLSFLFLARSIDSQELLQFAARVYGFVLSMVVVAYYVAITANYDRLLESMKIALQPIFLNVEPNLSSASVVGLLVIFFTPIFGLLSFARRMGPQYSGYAALPLLACFFWGCYATLNSMRKGFSTNFLVTEVPQLGMTLVLIFVGMSLLTKHLASSARSRHV